MKYASPCVRGRVRGNTGGMMCPGSWVLPAVKEEETKIEMTKIEIVTIAHLDDRSLPPHNSGNLHPLMSWYYIGYVHATALSVSVRGNG